MRGDFSLNSLGQDREFVLEVSYASVIGNRLEVVELGVKTLQVCLGSLDCRLCNADHEGTLLRLKGGQRGSKSRKSLALIGVLEGSDGSRGELELALVGGKVNGRRSAGVLGIKGLCKRVPGEIKV